MGSGPFIIGVGDTVCGRNGIVIGSDGYDCVCGVGPCRTGRTAETRLYISNFSMVNRSYFNIASGTCACVVALSSERVVIGASGNALAAGGCGLMTCQVSGLAGVRTIFQQPTNSNGCSNDPTSTAAINASVTMQYLCVCSGGAPTHQISLTAEGQSFAWNLVTGEVVANLSGTLTVLDYFMATTPTVGEETLSGHIEFRAYGFAPSPCTQNLGGDVVVSFDYAFTPLELCTPSGTLDCFGGDFVPTLPSSPIASGKKSGGCSGCGSQQGLE